MCLYEKLIFFRDRLFLLAILSLISFIGRSQDIVYSININFSKQYNPQGWNNTNSDPFNGLEISELLSNEGDTLPVSLLINSDWSGVQIFGAQSSDNSGIAPDSVLREYYWTGPYGGIESSTLSIGGLADSLLYTIEIFGSSTFGLAADSKTKFSIGSTTRIISTYFNLDASVYFDNIVVNEAGQIELEITPEDGGEIAMINGLTIKAYDRNLLAAPVNLSSYFRDGVMKLIWKDQSVIEEQFEIFRRAGSGQFESIGFTNKNNSSYIDATVALDEVYEYKVRAVDINTNTSVFSNTQKILAKEVSDSILVNFGSRRSVSGWNSFVTFPERGSRLSNLQSVSGVTSKFEIFLGSDWQDVGDDGAITNDNSGLIPDNALLEYYYFGFEDTTQTPTINISGLVPFEQYNIRFISSSRFSQVVDNGTTLYKINDDTTQLYVQDNSEYSALISGASADSNGTLVIEFFKGLETPVGYLNALIIESFEPLEPFDPDEFANDILLINGYKNIITVDAQGQNFEALIDTEGSEYHYGSLVEIDKIIYGVIKGTSNKLFAYNSLNGEYYILKTFDQGEEIYQIINYEGVLYGTSSNGNFSHVFKLNTDGSSFEVLVEMNGTTEGDLPLGKLEVFNGFLVGSTFSGGDQNLGTLYKVDLETDAFEVFHHFESSTGAWPSSGLTVGSDGILYGISQSLVNPYSYLLEIDNSFNVLKVDSIPEIIGSNISASLVASGDHLYGVSRSGGSYGSGTVFRYNIYSDQLEPLHSFNSVDAGSTCSLYVAEGSKVYGVSGAPQKEGGRLFSIDNNGFFRILTSFEWDGPAFNLSILPFTSGPAEKITETVAPGSLLAINNFDGTVTLTWEDLSVNETGFEVSRREYGGEYIILDTVNVDSVEYIDHILASKVYEYKVRALAKVGNSLFAGPRRVMTHLIANSIKVNFGLNHSVSDPTWNNFLAIPKSGIESSALNTATEGRTDVKIKLTSNWGGVQPQGSVTGDDSGAAPDQALQEYYWFGGFGAPETTSIAITGLPDSSLFDMVFIGSSQFPGVQDNGSTVYTVGDQSISLDVQENVYREAILSGVFSDENGEISVVLSKDSDSPLGYINAMIIQSVEPLGAVALAPGNLKGIYEQGELTLEWEDTNNTESGFEISRKEEGGEYMVIETLGANVTSYNDQSVESDKIYKYKVRVLSQFGNSPSSNEIKITTHSVNDIVRLNFGFRHPVESTGWNNLLAPPQNGLIIENLVTISEKVTHLSVKLDSDWGGVEASGTSTGNNTGIIPDEGLKEYYWFGTFGAPDTTALKLSGLVPGSLYNLRFVASSEFSLFDDNGTTIYVVGDDTASLYVHENTLNDAFIGGVLANTNGNINIRLMKASGTPVGYINALIIESVDELEEAPTPLGLEDKVIEVYPNPSEGHFIIKDVDYSIKSASLLGLSGKIIYDDLPINQTVDVANLKKGVYLIQIIYKNGYRSVKKILIN